MTKLSIKDPTIDLKKIKMKLSNDSKKCMVTFTIDEDIYSKFKAKIALEKKLMKNFFIDAIQKYLK